MKWIKRALKYLLFGLLGLFIAVEIYLRIAYHEELKLRTYPQIYLPDSLFGYRYIPDIEAEISVPSISKTFKINQWGYPGKPWKLEKEPGTFRIAIVGSSQGSGIWLDGDQPFPDLLEGLFQKAGAKVEVINCSVDGSFRDMDNLKVISHDVRRFKPDLVLANFDIPFVKVNVMREVYKGYVIFYNSAWSGSRANARQKIDYIEEHGLLQFLYRISYSVRALCRRYMHSHDNRKAENLEVFVKKKFEAWDLKFFPQASNVSACMIQDVRDEVHYDGGEMILYRYQVPSFFKSMADMYDLPYLDLAIPVTKGTIHEHDSHFNAYGHQQIASRLYEEIMARKLIPSLYLGQGSATP